MCPCEELCSGDDLNKVRNMNNRTKDIHANEIAFGSYNISDSAISTSLPPKLKDTNSSISSTTQTLFEGENRVLNDVKTTSKEMFSEDPSINNDLSTTKNLLDSNDTTISSPTNNTSLDLSLKSVTNSSNIT